VGASERELEADIRQHLSMANKGLHSSTPTLCAAPGARKATMDRFRTISRTVHLVRFSLGCLIPRLLTIPPFPDLRRLKLFQDRPSASLHRLEFQQRSQVRILLTSPSSAPPSVVAVCRRPPVSFGETSQMFGISLLILRFQVDNTFPNRLLDTQHYLRDLRRS
jgi:hypothetical protein